MIHASPLSSPPYYAPYDISHDDFLISPLYIYDPSKNILYLPSSY